MRTLLLFASLALAGISTATAAEFTAAEQVVRDRPVEEDLFAAGRQVTLAGGILGDLFTAGYEVRVTGPVAEDGFVAGYDVAVTGGVGGSLATAGMTVRIEGPVGDDLMIGAGEAAVLGPGAHVGGDLNASGARIDVLGDVDGEARLAGETVIIAGRIGGDVDVAAATLELLPGAVVLGSLRHTGPEDFRVPAGVDIRGTVTRREAEPENGGISILGAIGSAIALFVLGAVLFLVFPRFVLRSAGEVRAHPLRGGLVGLAAIILTPVLAILLMVTLIGIPIGLLLFLVWICAFPVGLALAGFGLAHAFARDRARQTGGDLLKRFALVVAVIGLVGLIPVLGGLFTFALTAAGMGALVMLALHARKGGLAAA